MPDYWQKQNTTAFLRDLPIISSPVTPSLWIPSSCSVARRVVAYQKLLGSVQVVVLRRWWWCGIFCFLFFDSVRTGSKCERVLQRTFMVVSIDWGIRFTFAVALDFSVADILHLAIPVIVGAPGSIAIAITVTVTAIVVSVTAVFFSG